MKFRPQRGSLEAAMREAVDVDGFDGLIAHLRTTRAAAVVEIDPAKITITPYSGDDPRIGWLDVHIVLLEGWGPLGFCCEVVDERIIKPPFHPPLSRPDPSHDAPR